MAATDRIARARSAIQRQRFKLHGSSNWRDAAGNPILILGGNKRVGIKAQPVLDWYAAQFDSYLDQPSIRLMIIGYGFRDVHINLAISRAVTAGLRIFVIDPLGSDVASALNLTNRPGNTRVASAEERMLKDALIGASRRPLRDIFGADSVEHNKVTKFFAG